MLPRVSLEDRLTDLAGVDPELARKAESTTLQALIAIADNGNEEEHGSHHRRVS